MAIENVKHRCGRRYVRKSRRGAGLRDLRCNGFGFILSSRIRREAKCWDELMARVQHNRNSSPIKRLDNMPCAQGVHDVPVLPVSSSKC
jgi:hypothetical protein